MPHAVMPLMFRARGEEQAQQTDKASPGPAHPYLALCAYSLDKE